MFSQVPKPVTCFTRGHASDVRAKFESVRKEFVMLQGA